MRRSDLARQSGEEAERKVRGGGGVVSLTNISWLDWLHFIHLDDKNAVCSVSQAAFSKMMHPRPQGSATALQTKVHWLGIPHQHSGDS